MIQQLTQKQHVYYPWVIYRQTAMGWLAVSQFRNRKDGEDYLKTLRQLSPTIHYELAFEPASITQLTQNHQPMEHK